MGEEEKKAGGEEKKVEEEKKEKVGEGGDSEKKEEKVGEGGGDSEKKKENEGGGDSEEKKKTEDSTADGKDSAPAPPPEIVLRVYMHCEGCARKVKKCLRGFNGVEDVTTDCKSHTVVVKGEKADPVEVLERVQRKSHRHVELLSPIPKPPAAEEKAAAEEPPKAEEKKEEPKPKVISVVLKVHMHCEACAQEIKKRIERMKEVESASPDLKSSEVTVKGTFDPAKLVDYVYKRTGKQAVIVKQDPEPEPEKKEEAAAKEGAEAEKKEEAAKATTDEGEKKEQVSAAAAAKEVEEDVERKVLEMRRNEYMFNNNNYPPIYAMEMYHAYPPQIFSDENPNACSLM